MAMLRCEEMRFDASGGPTSLSAAPSHYLVAFGLTETFGGVRDFGWLLPEQEPIGR